MRLTRIFLVCAASLVYIGCVVPMASPGSAEPVSPATTRGSYAATESRIFDLINAQRRHQELPPLVYNEQLDQMAKIQAQNMAHFRNMAHVIPDARLPTLADRAGYVAYQYGRLAENVALGYPDAETVVQGWMTSRGHRTNILNSAVAETGIGIARSSTGRFYYCQVFGRRRNPL